MDIVLLVKSIAGLSAILFLLLLFFIYTSKNKKNKRETKQKSYKPPTPPRPKYDWDILMKTLRNREATSQELQETLALILKYHGTIPNKLGIRVNPEFYKYSEVLMRLCRHPNTNKKLIIDFDRALEKKNPEYIREINDALTKGLNSLGV